MKKIYFLLLIPLCLSALDYYGDENSSHFSASIEKMSENILLTKTYPVHLKISYPKNFEIKTIAFDYDESEFLWKKERYIEKNLQDEKQIAIVECPFEAVLSGKHYLNLPTIHFVSKEDPKKYVSLHPPLFECDVVDDIDLSQNKLYSKGLISLDLKKSVEMDTYNTKSLINQSREDLNLAKIKLQDHKYQKMLSLFLVFALMLFTGYQMYKILKKKKSLKEVLGFQRDPREQAIEELNILKQKELPQKGFFDHFYVELTQIVRSYIERQYNVKAPEQTTQEFLQEVIGKKLFENEMKNHLEEFLKFADLVKFAKLHPEVQECAHAEMAAQSFIEASHYSES